MNNQNMLLNEINKLKRSLSMEYLKHHSLQHPNLIELSQLLDQKLNEYFQFQEHPSKQKKEGGQVLIR